MNATLAVIGSRQQRYRTGIRRSERHEMTAAKTPRSRSMMGHH
jgi:hypothetical protein